MEARQGGGRVIGGPDFLADGEEVGKGREGADAVLGQGAFGHDRHLDHLGPPLEQLCLGYPARAEGGFGHRAEGHVIGPQLAGGHAVVPRVTAEGADDGVVAQVLARLAHGAGVVGQVDAVEPVPFGDAQVGVHDDGHVPGMGDQRFDFMMGGRGRGRGRGGRKRKGDLDAKGEAGAAKLIKVDGTQSIEGVKDEALAELAKLA